MKKIFSDKSFLYLKFIYFIRYLADALFYSYTALYLTSIGFEEGLIGNIQSLTTITALIVNPIWSIILKDNKIAKKFMILLSIIEGTLIIVYGNLSIIEVIMLLTVLLAIVASPFYTMLDGYAATYCNENKKEFTSVRVIGSIAYVLGTFVGGILISNFGYSFLFILAGSIFISCGVLSSFLKVYEVIDSKGEKKSRSYKKILINKFFIFYLVSYILMVTISTIGDSYISLYFTKLQGLSVQEYSYVSTAILLCEVFSVIILTKHASKIKLEKLIIIAGLVYFIRSFGLSFVNLPLGLLISIACLRGLAWGLVIYTHIKFLIKLIGLENVTTGAMIVGIVGSIVNFVLSNFAGYLIEGYGYSLFYLIISISVLFITIVNVILYIYKKRKQLI